MREDVIKQISALNNINHVIVLTHNIDFIFLQTVFLSALKRCGHPSLTVFADEQCARESYRTQASLITGLGKRFRVVPVSMNPGYRFHPKSIFLVGEEQATLFVGSGNMTFGGMRDNVEIWNRFDSKNDEFSVLAAFRDYLNDLTNRVPFQDSIKHDLAELFDTENHDWATHLTEPSGLIGRVAESSSLVSQMRAVLGDKEISNITVSVPYFDPEAKALKGIAEQYPDAEIVVLIQSGHSTLFSEAANELPKNVRLKSIGFRDPNDENGPSRRFIHAKYFAFSHGDQVELFAGSANCSIAALVKGGAEGNAELVVHGRMSLEEFNEQFLNEFSVSEEMPKLQSQDQVEKEDEHPISIKLLGARYDINTLHIRYHCDNNLEIQACYINGGQHEFEILDSNELSIRTMVLPHTVYVTGLKENQQFSSNTIWVDHEASLRSTSKGRALLERLKSSDSSQDMQAEDWMFVVELFAKDLEYTTAKDFHRSKAKKEDDSEETKIIVSRSDVFSTNYDKAPDLSSRLMDSLGQESVNIYQLLLHAFGISTDHKKSSEQSENEENGDDNTVDQPVNLQAVAKQPAKPNKINDRLKRRIAKVVNAIVESFTDPTYLELRDPEGLNRDMQIAGLVLRKGLSARWIDNEQFFDATQKIWSKLFFSSKRDEPLGWLGIRYQKEADKARFRKSLATPQLAAVLFAWAIAVDVGKRDVLSQRFLLSMLLSMGRFPWLWHDDLDQEVLYTHLQDILRESPCKTDGDKSADALNERRINLLRQGVSLAVADQVLSNQDIGQLRDQLIDKSAEKGDVLWQGKRGLCISLENTEAAGDVVKVLCLQDPEGDTSFRKSFLLPIDQLVNAGLISKTEGFGPVQAKELSGVLEQLSSIQL